MTNEEAIKAIKANYPSGGYERLREALDMAIKSLEERKTMTHEEAVGFLQTSGWLQDHDRQIYEQGKRDGNDEHKTGKWIITKRNGILCGVCHSGFRRMPTLDGKPIFRYCPFCGAKMEGAEK